jgi:hypothetical protein
MDAGNVTVGLALKPVVEQAADAGGPALLWLMAVLSELNDDQ